VGAKLQLYHNIIIKFKIVYFSITKICITLWIKKNIKKTKPNEEKNTDNTEVRMTQFDLLNL